MHLLLLPYGRKQRPGKRYGNGTGFGCGFDDGNGLGTGYGGGSGSNYGTGGGFGEGVSAPDYRFNVDHLLTIYATYFHPGEP